MKLLVGIGNPGPQFEETRHNIGFRLLDEFARKYGISFEAERFEGLFGRGDVAGTEVALLKPLTFVNRTGRAVQAALDGFPEIAFEDDLVLLYDDLDLPLGRVRLRKSGSAGGHRGMADVIDTLESRAFTRLRFGIGRPPETMAARDYVLQKFAPAEERSLSEQIAYSIQALETLLADGVEAAMDRFNRESPAED